MYYGGYTTSTATMTTTEMILTLLTYDGNIYISQAKRTTQILQLPEVNSQYGGSTDFHGYTIQLE